MLKQIMQLYDSLDIIKLLDDETFLFYLIPSRNVVTPLIMEEWTQKL